MAQLKWTVLQFVALGIIVSATLSAGQAPGVPAEAIVIDWVVFPTGEFPADLVNVRAAVNLGGTVLLKATNAAGQPTAFNFGAPKRVFPRRGVNITTDVNILGEQIGDQMTTIQGGEVPFLGFVPVRSRIQGIHFDRPLLSAIVITRSTGSEIVGNRVSSAVGLFLPFLGLTEGRGIKFLGNRDPDGAITGRVRVVGNVIEDMHADLSDGIVFDAVAADIKITGNRIHTVQSSGILLINSKGLVSIEDNVIVPGPGDPAPEFSFGNGMTIFRNRGASYVVRRNTVVCENPQADGILLFEIASPVIHVIEKNEIVMQDSLFGAVSLIGGISNAFVGQNRVAGTGAFALDGFGFPSSLVQSSTFQGNNISRFASSFADVFLDEFTQDTVLVGHSGTVIDLGVNNRITGFTKIGNGEHIGPQVRDAQARKHEAISKTLKGAELDD